MYALDTKENTMTYAVTVETATYLRSHHLSIIPTRSGGTKSPAVPWRAYQEAPAPLSELTTWYGAGNPRNLGIAVVTGAVSGRLEMTEIEGRAASSLPRIASLMSERGYEELWDRLSTGWVELSPSGGRHWMYRLEPGARVPGSTKIARAATGEVLAETRGEGGYVIVAPTPGTHHRSGRGWERVAGGPDSIPVLTMSERAALHTVLTDVLDETPEAPEAPERPVEPSTPPVRAITHTAGADASEGPLRPGDDYERRTDWADILTPHGWALHSTLPSGERLWTRPGKDPRDGHSASTGYAGDRDRLYVFSSSVPGLDPDTPYTKFRAYSILGHGGDDSEAARALASAGYGQGASASVAGLDTQAPRTEYELALGFLATHGDSIRYNVDRGHFYHWDGARWVEQADTGGAVRQAYLAYASTLPGGDRDGARFRTHALSLRGTRAVLDLIRSDPRVACSVGDFDAHPWELNTPTGIVDLRTGALMPHDPARMHSKITSVAPAPGVPAPAWERFLGVTFAGDEALIRYVQRVLGYSATGAACEHLFVFAYGTGGNGKSVLYDAALGVLGDYATVAPQGLLMRTSSPSHPTDLADLRGMRLVVGSEVNHGDRFDEARLKALTGGDRIKARHMHQDFFTFTPTHHLHLMGNHQPTIEAGGASVWRRMRQVPFTHTVPEEERDESLPERLRTDEAQQILAWIIAGAVAYAQEGLQAPPAVLAATEDYRESQDTVAAWLDADCDLYPGNPHYTTSIRRVREEYVRWCRLEGVTPLSSRALATGLRAHGVLVGRDAPRVPSGADRVYGGMRLRSDQAVLDGSAGWEA